ncbi:MAG: ABC transporter substrate-binding protein [Elusimicrobia bacterium]|nr:ABC transporter substrate-binding protein [Elusimicrobiota bacterium]
MPPLQNSVYGDVVLQSQFEPLVRQGKTGLVEPLAAASWETSPDHRILRFKIDTRRRFSDGSPLTAADFKRSWEDGIRMQPHSANKAVEDALYSLKGYADFEREGTIEGIRVKGADTLELEFAQPARVPLGYLSGARYAAYKQAGGRAIGTGPYVMEENDKALIMTPNPYYASQEPLFNEIRMVVTPEKAVAQSLDSGGVDAAIFVETLDLTECRGGGAGNIRCVFSQEADHIAVRVNGLPGRIFADLDNRLAIQALVHERLAQQGLPAPLKVGHFKLDPQSFLKFQPGRLPDADAAELVRQGRGRIPGLIKASRSKPVYVVCTAGREWIVKLLRDAGVTVDERSGVIDFPRMLDFIYKDHQADLVLSGFSVYNGDPDGLYHQLGKKGAIYSPMEARKDIAELMEEGRGIMDRGALPTHYEKVARLVLTEVPYVHLGFRCRGVAYNPVKARVAASFMSRSDHRITLLEPR